jgi:hypothetical protein
MESFLKRAPREGLTPSHVATQRKDEIAKRPPPVEIDLLQTAQVKTGEHVSVLSANKDLSDCAILHFHKSGRHYVSCIPCCANPDIVMKFNIRGRLPHIAEAGGTIFRQATVSAHLQTIYHKQAKQAHHLKSIPVAEAMQTSQIGRAIIKANEVLASTIGSLMIHVYNDAKKLTLSSFSYPSRIVAARIANAFKINDASGLLQNVGSKDMQYLTPKAHRELLACIVESDRTRMADTIYKDSLALSLRCDGSVDRTQMDKIFVIAKIVTTTGEERLTFLGASEPQVRGAEGVWNSVVELCSKTLGKNNYGSIFRLMSSIVTDGASVNTGEKGGLWRIIEDRRTELPVTTDQPAERQAVDGPDIQPAPLLKIWCCVHRSNLAWQSVSSYVPELGHVFQELISLASFFHNSGLRSRELKKIADGNHLNLLHLPKVFEVR